MIAAYNYFKMNKRHSELEKIYYELYIVQTACTKDIE